MKILDGKAVAAAWRERLLGKITELKQKNCVPGLAIVLAGESKLSAGGRGNTAGDGGPYSSAE